jgi:hypothetical protein
MIPSRCYSREQFSNLYPSIPQNIPHDNNHHPILNDIPPPANSCRVYDRRELERHCTDTSYPIPESFKKLRGLVSGQAVFKTISEGHAVFSHMMISPEDASELGHGEVEDGSSRGTPSSSTFTSRYLERKVQNTSRTTLG